MKNTRAERCILKKLATLLFIFVFIVSMYVKPIEAVIYNTAETPLPVSTITDSFPSSYQPYINSLKANHPNWIFKAVNTGLDWNESVRQESYEVNTGISMVPASYSANWKKDGVDTYYNGEPNFVISSKKAVAYSLDPRNHINETSIFQFEALDFNAFTSTSVTVDKVIAGTVMSSYPTQYKKAGSMVTLEDGLTWTQIIINASKNAGGNGVSAPFLASRMKQETSLDILNNLSINGTHTTYPGVYNFFNIGATSGTTPVTNALSYASIKNWTTPAKSINEGATSIWSSYIKWGQNTVYFQKFDVSNVYGNAKALYAYQYMTNIIAPVSESKTTYNAYQKAGLLDASFVFYIPVYNNMPETISPHPDSDVTGTLTGTDLVYLDDGIANGTDYFNVRSGPGTEYNVITQVVESQDGAENRTKFVRTEVGNNGYDKIRLSDGREGYIYQAYVKAYSYTHVSSITLEKSDVKMNKGTTLQLNYTINPTNSYIKNVTFTSSNTNVATVDASGKITAVGNDLNTNVATITVITLDGNKTANCKVTVNTLATGIATNSEYAIPVGESLNFSPTFTPVNTTNKDYDIKIQDTNIAQLVDGKIKGVSLGSTNVTLTTKDGSNKSCVFKLNVVNQVAKFTNFSLDSVKNILTKVTPGTTVATVKNDITTTYTSKIVNTSGIVLTDTSNVGSGSKIQIIDNNNVIAEYTIIINGDVNGDSKISAGDYVYIKNHIMAIRKLQNYEQVGADVNKDGKISASDYVLIKNHIMGTKLISF